MRSPRKSLPSKLTAPAGLVFRKNRLLEAALTHPSYRNENSCPPLENFDRMEFLGDSILNFVICKKLYAMFPDANEGMLSRMRSILVSRKILARIAKSMKLTRSVKLGKGLSLQKNLGDSKLITDCFESLIAAIYFDQGLVRAEKFLLKKMDGYFNPKRLFRLDPNPKSTLQELALKSWKRLPQYVSTITPRGIKTVITLSSRHKATAICKTRRDSEEKAARILIQRIRQTRSVSRSKTAASGTKLRKIL